MTRRPRSLPVETTPQWQTIYCSLMLLLVVFFVMLIAHSTIDQERLPQLGTAALPAGMRAGQPPDLIQALQAMKRLAADSPLRDDFAVVETERGFKAVFPNPVLFDSGEASLHASAQPVLDGIVGIARRHRLSIQVEGHTDNVPIRTDRFPSNWELSAQRAVNILRYLHKSGGIPPERLVAVGFAEYRPAASNLTPAGRRINRRIEICFREDA